MTDPDIHTNPFLGLLMLRNLESVGLRSRLSVDQCTP